MHGSNKWNYFGTDHQKNMHEFKFSGQKNYLPKVELEYINNWIEPLILLHQNSSMWTVTNEPVS